MRLCGCVLVALALFLGDAARADEADRPWAQGVSEAEQKTALELFRQGNLKLKDSLFVQAVDKYREALQHWDHPAIHYNLAFALMNLDQPIEVYEHLEKALQYGVAPLDQEKFEHARSTKALIEKQLARVEVTCDEPDAQVTMDGKVLFTAPGKYESLVRAGPHTVVATKQGYITQEKSPSFPPGETTTLVLKLFRAEDLTEYRRKWAVWKPWVVVGSGAALVLTAGIMHWQALGSFDDFDKGIEACGGCVPTPELQDKKDTGELLQTMAIVGYGVGAAALVTGATLAYVNRERPFRVNPEEHRGVSVVPLFGPGSGGVLATFHF